MKKEIKDLRISLEKYNFNQVIKIWNKLNVYSTFPTILSFMKSFSSIFYPSVVFIFSRVAMSGRGLKGITWLVGYKLRDRRVYLIYDKLCS